MDYIRASYNMSFKYSQYFDEDIFRFGKNEVFVDCGGYIGDTAEEFIKRCENYNHVYVYEPLMENYIKCQSNLANYKNITIRQAGVGRIPTKMLFTGGGTSGSFVMTNQEDKDKTIEVTSLDEDIKEKITFIKMDLECFELEAIRGAAGHIRNDTPKLAVSLYHTVSDIWEIPKLINDINPNYNYYLRHYHSYQNWEYILYAIPINHPHIRINNSVNLKKTIAQDLYGFLSDTEPYMERLDEMTQESAIELYRMYETAAYKATANIAEINPELRVTICDRQDMILERVIDLVPKISCEKHFIFSPAIHSDTRWTNTELMKDCGVSGYMLAKETGALHVMLFGTKPSDYPYLVYMPEMKMLYDDSSSDLPDAYNKHLNESYSEMDALILSGIYIPSINYLNAYRNLRPDGKVYCALDMNKHWMNRISWDGHWEKKFALQCDLIATSCRSVRDTLNRNPKVHFPCHWLTNGFFNPTGAQVAASPEQKENIILTSGRIGTRQKNNGELLSAFALVSNILTEWKVRLVGPIEPEFSSFIDNYFTLYPDLKNRVIFTGKITDKAELYKEYAKAKIFALTSLWEGAPNVYAEALYHGCMFVTSDIDAADDVTNYGKLGLSYKSGDIRSLAGMLLQLSLKSSIRAFQKHIPLALDYAAKYFDWNRNAKKLAFMLYGRKL